MTSQKQISLFTEDKSKSSQEDSLANPSQWQESEKGKMTNAIYGTKCLEQFKKLNPHTSSQKMSLVSRILMGDWYSSRCALTWKVKGTKFNRLLFQLLPKTHRTEGTESGLLPTPNTCDAHNANNKDNHDVNKGYLRGYATMGMLPTPCRFDYNSARTEKKWEEDKKKYAEKGINLQMGLKQMARFQMLPTPTAGEHKHGKTEKYWKNRIEKGRQEDLSMTIHKATGKTSQLNPQFVEEMMGFPENWTLSPFQNGDPNQ